MKNFKEVKNAMIDGVMRNLGYGYSSEYNMASFCLGQLREAKNFREIKDLVLMYASWFNRKGIFMPNGKYKAQNFYVLNLFGGEYAIWPKEFTVKNGRLEGDYVTYSQCGSRVTSHYRYNNGKMVETVVAY
jgi:uncharacterized protein (DUF3820 family)